MSTAASPPPPLEPPSMPPPPRGPPTSPPPSPPPPFQRPAGVTSTKGQHMTIRDGHKDAPSQQARLSQHRHDWRMQPGRPCPALPAAARRPCKAYLSQVMPNRIPVPHRQPAPCCAKVAPMPPLASALQEAGFGGRLIRRLVDAVTCSTVEQLLRLSKVQLDVLLDEVRPLPGERNQVHAFVSANRGSARPASAPDQRNTWNSQWRPTLLHVRHTARQRGRSCQYGPAADIKAEHYANWARAVGEPRVKLAPSSAQVHMSSVRVLSVTPCPGSVAKARVMEYEPAARR